MDITKIKNCKTKIIGEDRIRRCAVCIALVKRDEDSGETNGQDQELREKTEKSLTENGGIEDRDQNLRKKSVDTCDYDILFQVRSNNIPDQPGDICLPGGMMEEGESPKETACREISEELLIDKQQFEVIGPSDIMHTESIIVFPYVGVLKDYKGTFSEAEVAKVFTVPVEFFINNKPEVYDVFHDVKPGDDFPYERINGGKSYKWRGRRTKQLFYQYGEYCIWGLTAKVVTGFVEMLERTL